MVFGQSIEDALQGTDHLAHVPPQELSLVNERRKDLAQMVGYNFDPGFKTLPSPLQASLLEDGQRRVQSRSGLPRSFAVEKSLQPLTSHRSIRQALYRKDADRLAALETKIALHADRGNLLSKDESPVTSVPMQSITSAPIRTQRPLALKTVFSDLNPPR